MKLSILRAAAHNIADSFANGCSFLAGWYDTTFVWQDVAAHPAGELTFDLLDIDQDSPAYSCSTSQFLAAMRAVVPQQLRREGCDPELVARLSLTLRKSIAEPISGREVLVSVADTIGRVATDRYVGNPLRRMQVVDLQGRRRRLRNPVNIAS